MRPPEFTGGNRYECFLRPYETSTYTNSFNEAAGIHRRKPRY